MEELPPLFCDEITSWNEVMTNTPAVKRVSRKNMTTEQFLEHRRELDRLRYRRGPKPPTNLTAAEKRRAKYVEMMMGPDADELREAARIRTREYREKKRASATAEERLDADRSRAARYRARRDAGLI